MVTVPFHDNLEATPLDGLSCLVEVERAYGLDWTRFDGRQREALARVYQGLPGAVRHRDEMCWFGDDEDVPPFLRASVEPTGLRVHGFLPEDDWRAWDERFRTGAAGLPGRVRRQDAYVPELPGGPPHDADPVLARGDAGDVARGDRRAHPLPGEVARVPWSIPKSNGGLRRYGRS